MPILHSIGLIDYWKPPLRSYDMLKLVVYAANTGVLPEESSDRWSKTDSPGTPADLGSTMAALTPQGILHISDTDTFIPEVTNGHRHIYARYDTLNSTDNAIFEINCHLNSSGGSYGVGFGFTDTQKALEVFLRPGSIFVLVKQGTEAVARSVEFTSEDKFHTYQIIKTGAVKMEVYADSTLVFDIPYNELADRTIGFERQVVATSRSDPAEWDITYVSYSISS
jgi:hypothetical protein